jgi:hypothetical protein
MLRWLGIFFGVGLAALLPFMAPAQEHDLVWGKAWFGMTERQIQETYGDDLRASKMNASAPTTGGPGILRVTKFYLVGQTFETLDRCRVEFTFFQSRMASVSFMCFGPTKEEINALLQKRYGSPGRVSGDGNDISWARPPRFIAYSRSTGIFSISDQQRGDDAMRVLFHPKRAPPTAPPPSELPPTPESAPDGSTGVALPDKAGTED